jgi:hypothetical protein
MTSEHRCAAVALLLAACGSTSAGGSPQLAAAGGPGASSAGSSNAGAAGASAGSSGELCPSDKPAVLAGATARVSLPIRVSGSGAPLTTGQVVTPTSGSPYQLSLLKFFVSQPVLILPTGARVAAQLLNAAGTPRAYGLLLVDLDDPTSLALNLAAPAGDYAGLELGIGVPEPCNGGDPTLLSFPLNADGDMYWSWGARYMFIRIEGTEQADGAWTPFTHHVGFQQNFRLAQVTGAIHTSSGTPPALQVDIDHMLALPAGTVPDASEAWVADNMSSHGVLTLVP